MIKFFRKIRHKLLHEGKIVTYLKYTLGEILLVVIGILIALQINNWNESQKQYHADIEFLNNLKGEIILDTLALSSQIKWYNELNENIRKTLVMIDTSTTLTEEEEKFISRSLVEAEYLLPTSKDFDRNAMMIASGSIKRLDTDLHYYYLRYLELFQYNYDLTIKQANSLVDIINTELYPTVDLNFIDTTKNNVAFDLLTLKNNRITNNALQKSIYYRDATITLNKPILKRARNLISRIDNLLENQFDK